MTPQLDFETALLTIRDASPPESGFMAGVDTWSALVEELQKIAGDAVAGHNATEGSGERTLTAEEDRLMRIALINSSEFAYDVATQPARDAAEGAECATICHACGETLGFDESCDLPECPCNPAPPKPVHDAMRAEDQVQFGRRLHHKPFPLSAPVSPADETSITINREILYRAISNHLPSDMIDVIWQEVIEALELKP